MKIYKYTNFATYRDLDKAINAARRKKVDMINHVYYEHPELGKVRLVTPKSRFVPELKLFEGTPDAYKYAMTLDTNKPPMLLIGTKPAPQGVIEHEFKHRLDAKNHPALYNLDAYRQTGNPAVGDTHLEEYRDPFDNNKIKYNRASLTERRADEPASKTGSIQDQINYIKYLNKGTSDNKLAQIKQVKQLLADEDDDDQKSESDYARMQIDAIKDQMSLSNAVRPEALTEEAKAKRKSRVPLAASERATEKFGNQGYIINEDMEPRRVHSFIMNSLNHAGDTYADNGFESRDAARAAAAQQWADSGAITEQTARNLKALADHYNKTGQWFGYFSKVQR